MKLAEAAKLIDPSDEWRDAHGNWQVLAIVANYVICRRPGCMVTVFPASDFIENNEFVRHDAFPSTKVRC